MDNKKLSDNEIIKALECCTNDDHCGDCFLVYGLHDCKEKQLNLLKDALDLINRQKAEIERLEGEKSCIIEHLKGTRIRLKTAKAEAIKEFAERLNDTKFWNGNEYVIYADNIDVLVKEMVGDDNA